MSPASPSEPIPQPLITSIRHSSRLLVRELGFTSTSLAGTALSASAVHTLIELGRASLSAAALAPLLHRDKSSTSRLVRRLGAAGLVLETPSPRDGREKVLALAPAGREALAAVDAFADARVGGALAGVPVEEREAIERGLRLYAAALRSARVAAEARGEAEGEVVVNGVSAAVNGVRCSSDDIAVVAGYRAGIVARSVEMHATYYAEHHGFGRSFETELAIGLGRLVRRLDDPGVEAWAAIDGDGKIVGTVFVDVVDAHDAEFENWKHEDEVAKIAHLRMFIVEQGLQGKGVGRRLLVEAIAFVDAVGYAETKLWTFRGLEAAKKLYERFGFIMVQEEFGNRWSTPVHVQLWVRKRGSGDAAFMAS